MSLAEASSRYAVPPEGHDPSRAALPTLPSMSALLNPPNTRTEYAPALPPARQFGPPYNLTKESSWRPQEGPAIPPAQYLYPPPPPPPPSYFSQSPTEPVLLSQQTQPFAQHDLAVPYHGQPIAQRRQFKKIKGRSAVYLKDGRPEGPPPEGPRPSPLRFRSFEQEANYSPEKDVSAHSPPVRAVSEASTSRTSMPTHSPRPFAVSGLLSEPQKPRTAPLGPTYSIRMRQQPIAARACGFGERDRRVIDPPPILQMDVHDPHASPEELAALIRQPYAVVHCTLWDPVNDCDDTAMPSTTDKRQQRRLMGTLVSSPFVGKDEFNVEGCFFTFPDLSVRTPGTYSLRFQLVILNAGSMGIPGSSSPVRSVVKSASFNVFNAKDFRGMRASTALTKTLKHQGCLISVKKGNNRAETHGRDEEEEEEEEEGEDDQEGGDSTNPGKRAKRPRR